MTAKKTNRSSDASASNQQQGAQAQRLIRIDPKDAPKLVTRIMESIMDATRTDVFKCNPVPGNAGFKSMTGSFEEHTFTLKYTDQQERDQKKSMYICFDIYEFVVELNNSDVEHFVNTMEQFVSNTYMYDLNSKSYVLRPKELGFTDDVKSSVFSFFKRFKMK